MNSIKNLLQKLGPGILYAGAAIGVSHLVQSTRAGASFGWSMILVAILANFFKYPFFQIGPLYVARKGKDLLHAYSKIGNWAVWTFFLITISTMFIIQGAITMVTAGLASYIFGTEWPLLVWIVIILLVCIGLLFSGKVDVLNRWMRVIIFILSITTIVAAIASFFADIPKDFTSPSFDWATKDHVFFLIAFIGWMPAPIDISVWYSVWTKDSDHEKSGPKSLKDVLFDFSIGYWGTAFLAICFIVLGVCMLHNTGTQLSPNAVVFASQIIDAYGMSLGTWSKPIIAVAALSTMFSTTLSVMDGISRGLSATHPYLNLDPQNKVSEKRVYLFWLFTLTLGAFVTIYFLGTSMHRLVDIATTISFLTAPILAYFNWKIIKEIALEFENSISRFQMNIGKIGLIIMTLFAVIYLYYRFML